MTDPIVVSISCEILGEPVMGLWCDHCNLPSKVIAACAIRIGGGTPTLDTVEACFDCGWQAPE